MSGYLTEIEWETVEQNLSMLTDETLERFLRKIRQIKKDRKAQVVTIFESAFE